MFSVRIAVTEPGHATISHTDTYKSSAYIAEELKDIIDELHRKGRTGFQLTVDVHCNELARGRAADAAYVNATQLTEDERHCR